MDTRIRKLAERKGESIPKPEVKADFTIKGMGRRRGEEAMIYRIPSHSEKSLYYEKGITLSEFKTAYYELIAKGNFTRTWFNENMKACAKEGGCNFTTIGGVFILLDLATYSERGIYQQRA